MSHAKSHNFIFKLFLMESVHVEGHAAVALICQNETLPR